MAKCNENVAMVAGVNAGIIAELLNDILKDELENVSHRECTTGFYYRREDADKTTVGASDSKYVLVAQIHKELDKNKQDELYNLGQKTYSDFYAQIDAMHPSAMETASLIVTLSNFIDIICFFIIKPHYPIIHNIIHQNFLKVNKNNTKL